MLNKSKDSKRTKTIRKANMLQTNRRKPFSICLNSGFVDFRFFKGRLNYFDLRKTDLLKYKMLGVRSSSVQLGVKQTCPLKMIEWLCKQDSLL